MERLVNFPGCDLVFGLGLDIKSICVRFLLYLMVKYCNLIKIKLYLKLEKIQFFLRFETLVSLSNLILFNSNEILLLLGPPYFTVFY